MKNTNFLIITINSTHLVMKVEKILLNEEIEIEIIPLPHQLDSSCGFSIKGNLDDVAKIYSVLFTHNIDLSLLSFYSCEKNGLKKFFTPLNLEQYMV